MYKEGSKVSIMGIPHTITLKDDSLSNGANVGMIEYTKAKITLNGDMTDELAAETLTHEILHGILVHMGRDDLSSDERFVQGLANAVYQSFVPIVY